MKLLDYFDAFLRDTVNLDQARLDVLKSRVDSIVAVAGLDDIIGPRLIEHIPQGSWAHRTIIKPLPGDEFDADFLLHLEEDDEWSADPKRYLAEVEAAFKRSTDYGDKTRAKTRCVRIVYADDCHVDVVPYVIRSDDTQAIVNRADNAFEETNPDGFTAWMKERDDLAAGNLRRVIRLLKYLRDYKNTFSCKSVILTTVTGERVKAIDAETRHADTPTALKNIVNDLDAWLQFHPTRPSIEDPSCPGTNFDHRWDQATYSNFREQIHRYAAWITDAYDEPDRDRSVEKWQKVFGPDFKQPTSASVAHTSVRAARPPDSLAPSEEFIRDRYPVALAPYRAMMTGRMVGQYGSRDRPIRHRASLPKNRDLRFRVDTDVPEPYEVLWKVRNFGPEAEAANGLRGEIKAGSANEHHESTLYRGTHWIECYIVKDGKVVATDRHMVTIG